MAARIGYVSSFEEWESFGFLRPADDPQNLVLFRQSALDEDAVDHLTVGLEVVFEIDPNPEHPESWPVARSVKINVPPADDDDDAAVVDIDAL